MISASSTQTHLSCAVLCAALRSTFRGWYLLNRQNDANVSCSFTCSPLGSYGDQIWGHQTVISQKSVFFQWKISVYSSGVWAGLWTLCWTNPGSTGHHCPAFWGWWVQRKEMNLELLASCEEQTKVIDLFLQKTQNNHELLIFLEIGRTHFHVLWNDLSYSEFLLQTPPPPSPSAKVYYSRS